ncbi:response regulator [Runella slithyformis]|uniref:Response regulator receiver protein n=1 Tax=Runella slithyformis (strain ATCC 29530 / DSM 19594 / LMG 11500 / NCIMB 11436 / LSU 4) TaxID=761193 RepID=A0A7U3ZID6_RUNSL|nr:response regulator [Runella slithyformis]AEI47790.1 response regulator receiver protein [Runella slithyformis DSM 19594]
MNKHATILIADDDTDDRFLLQSVFEECGLPNPTVYVKDGLELIEYIRRSNNEYLVGLILLDLNMPRMDGREVLKIVKSEPQLRKIPVVVLSTSKAEQDINDCYDLGANCYIAKPSSFDVFTDTISTLIKFWVKLTHLPVIPESARLLN